jgi:hypothetical protein
MVKGRVKKSKIIAPKRTLAYARAVIRHAIKYRPFPAKGHQERFYQPLTWGQRKLFAWRDWMKQQEVK